MQVLERFFIRTIGEIILSPEHSFIYNKVSQSIAYLFNLEDNGRHVVRAGGYIRHEQVEWSIESGLRGEILGE